MGNLGLNQYFVPKTEGFDRCKTELGVILAVRLDLNAHLLCLSGEMRNRVRRDAIFVKYNDECLPGQPVAQYLLQVLRALLRRRNPATQITIAAARDSSWRWLETGCVSSYGSFVSGELLD